MLHQTVSTSYQASKSSDRMFHWKAVCELLSRLLSLDQLEFTELHEDNVIPAVLLNFTDVHLHIDKMMTEFKSILLYSLEYIHSIERTRRERLKTLH